MAVQYTEILEHIGVVLANGIANVRVEVDPPFIGDSAGDEIGIILERQESTQVEIGSSEPYHGVLHVSIVVSAFSPDGVQAACKRRDSLVGQVFDLLKTDRTLGGNAAETWLTGNIDFETVPGEAGIFSGAVLEFRVHLMA